VKEKLLKYVELQAQLYKRDKCGLSWALLKQKALFYAKQLGHDLNSLKAGNYFISSVLQKGNKKCVALHGEGMEMREEDKALHRADLYVLLGNIWRTVIPVDCIYNADQTGLFTTRSPIEFTLIKRSKITMALSR
jgi:hypothetical protein